MKKQSAASKCNDIIKYFKKITCRFINKYLATFGRNDNYTALDLHV